MSLMIGTSHPILSLNTLARSRCISHKSLLANSFLDATLIRYGMCVSPSWLSEIPKTHINYAHCIICVTIRTDRYGETDFVAEFHASLPMRKNAIVSFQEGLNETGSAVKSKKWLQSRDAS